MKKSISFMVAVLFVVCAFVGVAMQQNLKISFADYAISDNAQQTDVQQNYSISVFGQASKFVTPDKAKVFAKIETLDLDKQVAKKQNNETFKKVVSALEKSGIEKEKIVLDCFQCYATNGDCCYDETGFRVSTTISVETSVDNLSNLFTLLTENGVTNISHINFLLSNQNEVQQQALTEALKNAKIKAQKITGNANLQVVSVKEENMYYCSNLYKDFCDLADFSIPVGQVEVEAKVNVTFQ